MPNPLALVPVALAAGGGRLDGIPAPALVASGFTLLQRSAPLVRALAGRRSAILLPPSAAVLAALAASDGHGAVLLAPDATAEALSRTIATADVGAVFTCAALAGALPADVPAVVLLDDAPRRARVRARGAETVVDLGTHFGLDLEGEEDDGSDEECVIVPDAVPARSALFTHRNLLALARGAVDATSLLPGDRVLWVAPVVSLGSFALACAGPLLAGAQVVSEPAFDAATALARVEREAVTMLALAPAQYAALADVIAARGAPWQAAALRVCTVHGGIADVALQARWAALTGVELRQAFGVHEAPLVSYSAPHFPNRHGTLGVPFPGVQAAVRHGAAAVPAGDPGTLCVRGAQVSGAYLGDQPAADRDDEWRDTGVRVTARDDGTLELAG